MNNRDKLPISSTVRTIAYLLVSLLCSLMLWIYVTETEGNTTDKPFPGVAVRFDGLDTMRESRGLIVSDISTTSGRVTLTGSRRTLASLNANDLTINVDLSGITRTGNYSLAPYVTYPSRIDASTITAEISPETVQFYVDILDHTTVEVMGEFNGSAAEGFVAEPLEFNPRTVILYGPEQVLRQVHHAFVDVTRTDVNRTLTFESTFRLMDSEGNEIESDEITFDTDTVNVTLPISAVKDVALVVELAAGGGATEANALWRLEPDHITLTGDSETLAGVNNISVAKIDLAQIPEGTFTETYRIVIPNDTEITSGARETTLTLELSDLYSRELTVPKSNISCINISEGYHADIVNDSLENVVLRGADEDAVRRVSEVNVYAVADLAEYGAATGIVSVPVRIRVDGSAGVGAVGEYKIYVNIQEGAAEPASEEETG